MLHLEDDDSLFRLFLHTKYTGLKIFILNLFQMKNSILLLQNSDVFLSDDTTRVPFLRAVNDHDKIFDSTAKIFVHDVPCILDSALKTGRNIAPFIQAIRGEYIKNKPVWLAALLNTFAGDADEFKLSELVGKFSPNLEMGNAPIKVIGITKVLETGKSMLDLTQHMLNYCDHVIVAIHPDKMRSVQKFMDSDISFIAQPETYNDGIIYSDLISKGREVKATHFLHMDDDERLSPCITRDAIEKYCSFTCPGDVISLPWVQQIGAEGQSILNFNSLEEYSNYRNFQPFKDIIFHDTGSKFNLDMPFHSNWAPINSTTKRWFLDAPLLHFEGLDLDNLLNKYNRYIYWDYSINSSFDMVCDRYLPLLFRNIHLIDPCLRDKIVTKNPFLGKPVSIHSFEKTFCRLSIDEVRLKYPVANPKDNKLLASITGPLSSRIT